MEGWTRGRKRGRGPHLRAACRSFAAQLPQHAAAHCAATAPNAAAAGADARLEVAEARAVQRNCA
eukprot:364502-Chlamydomonas_euryale.AAC.10